MFYYPNPWNREQRKKGGKKADPSIFSTLSAYFFIIWHKHTADTLKWITNVADMYATYAPNNASTIPSVSIPVNTPSAKSAGPPWLWKRGHEPGSANIATNLWLDTIYVLSMITTSNISVVRPPKLHTNPSVVAEAVMGFTSHLCILWALRTLKIQWQCLSST